MSVHRRNISKFRAVGESIVLVPRAESNPVGRQAVRLFMRNSALASAAVALAVYQMNISSRTIHMDIVPNQQQPDWRSLIPDQLPLDIPAPQNLADYDPLMPPNGVRFYDPDRLVEDQ